MLRENVLLFHEKYLLNLMAASCLSYSDFVASPIILVCKYFGARPVDLPLEEEHCPILL